MQETDEQSLYERIRSGDSAAFDALFRAYYRDLTVFAMSYVRELAVAEDLVQNIFARLWNQRDRWELRTNLRAYLFSAVRHEVLHDVRHRRVVQAHQSSEIDKEEAIIARDKTDDAVLTNSLEQAIACALASMPERRRTAYLLRRQQELSYVQIADIMDTTTKTVEHQIALALKDLRRALADWLD